MRDINIIQNKLKLYNLQSKQDELNAIKEIIQEIVLAAFSRTDFFKQVAFQGGTCLRIVHALQRFSEDLDFMLIKSDKHFNWQGYLNSLQLEFQSYGFQLEVQDRSKAENNVKKAFIKESSFGKILNLSFPRNAADIQKVQIKLEIDTEPPEGSEFEVKYLNFPYPYSITLQNLQSLFAGKCHALLCRQYIKGRDWFDFIWYISNQIPVNLAYLKNGLFQTGQWQNQELNITNEWLIDRFREKINVIDWERTKNDVARFLKPRELETLKLWGLDFFNDAVEKLEKILIKPKLVIYK